MQDTLYNCITLTGPEFLLLCSSAGIDGIGGLFRSHVGEPSDEELREAMVSLCGRELLEMKEENGKIYYQADRTVSHIFQTLISFRFTALLYKQGAEDPGALGYIGEYTVVTEVSDTAFNMIRLFRLPFEEFIAWACEENYLPEGTDPEQFMADLERESGKYGVEVKRIDSDRYLCTGIG